MKQFDVVTFGEVLVRMSVSAGQRIQNFRNFEVHPAGAEANVAANLSRLGCSSAFLTAMPDHAIARGVEDQLKQAGVDTSGVDWRQSGRLGTFFVEYAKPPRPIQVIYDRAGSCAEELAVDDIWFERAKILHLSGITPALSKNNLDLVSRSIQFARENGMRVSFDINYRAKLWSPKEAREALTPLIHGVDVLFCSQRDAQTIWGIDKDGMGLIDELSELTEASQIVATLGDRGAVCRIAGDDFESPALSVELVDRLGAGDALVSGYLFGLLNHQPERALKYGVTMAALALSQYGDFVQTSRAELEYLALAAGDISVCR